MITECKEGKTINQNRYSQMNSEYREAMRLLEGESKATYWYTERGMCPIRQAHSHMRMAYYWYTQKDYPVNPLCNKAGAWTRIQGLLKKMDAACQKYGIEIY